MTIGMSSVLPFRDRSEAGQVLARHLSTYRNRSDVGLWYQDFTQTTDDEVRMLVNPARREPSRVQ
jgi:predicted phosphoribosyltransferase